MNKLKISKILLPLIIVIMILLGTVSSFAEMNNNISNVMKEEQIKQEVKKDLERKIKLSSAPTVAEQTDRIIILSTDEYGDQEYKSIKKDEWIKSKSKSILSNSKEKIEYVQPDYIRKAYGTVGKHSWGVARVGADTLSQQLVGRRGRVVVAVIDTGTDSSHSLLKGRTIPGYNFVDNNTNTQPRIHTEDHGTHVSGIIADSTPSNVKIMPVRVLNEDGEGHDLDISRGVRWATDNGAHVINLSLGGPAFSQVFQDAILYAKSKGVVVVVASGNEAYPTTEMYPAGEEEVIVVGSIDKKDRISYFSNYGSTVDLTAPGEEIKSSVPKRDGIMEEPYKNFSGTSMSTPHVSGVAALLKLSNSSLSNDQIENILLSNVDDKGDPGRDKFFGEGILNMKNYKVDNSDNPIEPQPQPEPEPDIAFEDLTLNIGDTVRLTVYPSTIWLTENQQVATVNDEGIVEAVGRGRSKIILIDTVGNIITQFTVTVEGNSEQPEQEPKGDYEFLNGDSSPRTNIELDKIWTVRFNQEVEDINNLYDKIFVINNRTNKKEDIRLEISENGKQVRIINNNLYKQFNSYTVYISSDVKNKTNEKNLNKGIKIEFLTN